MLIHRQPTDAINYRLPVLEITSTDSEAEVVE
jgi:hypothetical protein